jgi:cytoskeletal protein CcmA (bactofilin family)
VLEVKRRMWKVICAALLATSSVQAIEFVQTEQFVRGEEDVLQKELWVSAQTITIDGGSSNDLFATAINIDLNGTFSGDVWAGGGNILQNLGAVNAAGIFMDDVRMVSRIAQISGTLHGSLIAGGTTVKIDPTAILYGDALCFGGNVIIEGSIAGNVRIMAKQVTLGGKIDGDVSIVAEDIVVLPGTILNGDLTYTAPKELVLSSSVVLAGELTRTFEAAPPQRFLKGNLGVHFLFGFAALVTGLVFIGLLPRYAGGTAHALRQSRGLSTLIGFAALVMLPAIAVLLFFTVIGLPLSMLIFLFYIILLYLSKLVVALALGSAILRLKEFSKRTAAAPLALGLLIIYTLTSVVALSLILNILIAISGLGALLLTLFKKPVLVIQTGEIPKQ